MEKWIFKLQTNGDMTTEWNGRFLTIWTANKNKQKTALKSKSIYMYYNILFFKLEDNYNIVMVSAIRQHELVTGIHVSALLELPDNILTLTLNFSRMIILWLQMRTMLK